MKAIYRFKQGYGRMGDLSGIFVAEKEDVQNIIGENVYFGEVLGKHSDIDCKIDTKNTTQVSDSPEDVAFFERLKLQTGFNPLDYYEPEEDEDEDEDSE